MTTPLGSAWARSVWGRSARRRSALDALRDAVADGRAEVVAETLHRAVTLVVDGGGRVSAPSAPVRGRHAAAAALVDVLPRDADSAVTVASVNGAPALVVRRGAEVVAVVVTALRGRRIATMWVVVNPDKLVHWNRSS